VVPIRIENVPPKGSLEYFLSAQHWLDALTPPLALHLQHLAETIKLLLQRIDPAVRLPDLAPPPLSTQPRKPFLQRFWKIGAATLCAFAVLALFWRISTTSPAPPKQAPAIEAAYLTPSIFTGYDCIGAIEFKTDGTPIKSVDVEPLNSKAGGPIKFDPESGSAATGEILFRVPGYNPDTIRLRITLTDVQDRQSQPVMLETVIVGMNTPGVVSNPAIAEADTVGYQNLIAVRIPNVSCNGIRGTAFHISFQVTNAQGIPSYVSVEFTAPDGSTIKAKSDAYRGYGGVLNSVIYVAPTSSDYSAKDIVLFVPYGQFPDLNPGQKEQLQYLVRVAAFNSGKSTALSGSFSFPE
jgi:hypothetical protein